MDNSRLEKMARVLVEYSLGVKKGELFHIEGTELGIPLMLSVYKEGLKAGAYPHIYVTPEEVIEILLKKGSDEQIRYVSEVRKCMVEKVDVYLGIGGVYNTKRLSNVEPKKQALERESKREINMRFLERASKGELRWCGCQYPTHSCAQDAGMSISEYEDFVFSACLLNEENPIEAWEKVSREQEKYVNFLNTKTKIRIISRDTDLSLSVDGRKWINCDGHENFPDGEVFTGPVENSVQGKIRFSYPAIYGGREVEDVSVVFESGKVISANAKRGNEFLQAMLEIDSGARYVGEFSIATNYGIKEFTKNILFDEKIGGTIHIALGASYPKTGGKNISGLHWDMICDLRVDGEIYGDGEIFYKNGKFLI